MLRLIASFFISLMILSHALAAVTVDPSSDAAQLVSKIYVGYFNRAADPAGLNYWVSRYNSGMSASQIAQSFSVQTEATNSYAYLANPYGASVSTFLTSVYQNLFNRAPDAAGLAYWTGEINSGRSNVGSAIINIISGAQDSGANRDLTTLTNKLNAGLNWAQSMANATGVTFNSAAAASAAAVVASVTSEPSSVTSAAAMTANFFANGGVTTDLVVTTVQPTLKAAIYSESWTSSGSITFPSTSAKMYVSGNGSSVIVEDGSLAKPFNQTTLTPNGPSGIAAINDPNAVVQSPLTGNYNLRWGTPDKNGPVYANAFSSGSYTFPSYFIFMGHIVSGQCQLGPAYGYCLNGATAQAPLNDVLNAWKQGWTGNGVNFLMVDGYSNLKVSGSNASADAHGIVTMALVSRYAIAAQPYGLDFGSDPNTLRPTGTIKQGDGSALQSSITIGVINASFGANYWALVNHQGSAITSADVTHVFQQTQPGVTTWTRVFNGTTTFNGVSLTDAVITKSAGNDNISADKESYVFGYANDANISPRLLIVGALNSVGSVTNRASLGSNNGVQYTNYAGANLAIQSRFLLASGLTPFSDGAVAVDGQPIPATLNDGTSYAAPRVAGYAAIVRQKFPNLTGANTANVLLATARYDTLSCYPNCDKAVYGQGEASLSRALAPVGYLK